MIKSKKRRNNKERLSRQQALRNLQKKREFNRKDNKNKAKRTQRNDVFDYFTINLLPAKIN